VVDWAEVVSATTSQLDFTVGVLVVLPNLRVTAERYVADLGYSSVSFMYSGKYF